MPQAARLGDPIGHTPPGDGPKGSGGGDKTGKIIGPCSGNVFTNGIKAARAHVDETVCSKHNQTPPPIATGSPTVFINGLPAARVSDKIACGAFIIEGSNNVFIGGGAVQTDPIMPEGMGSSVADDILTMVEAGATAILQGPVASVLDSLGSDLFQNSPAQVNMTGQGPMGAFPQSGPGYDKLGNYNGARENPSNEDRHFKIGKKDFIVKGGTAAQQIKAEKSLREIFATPTGTKALKQLEQRGTFFKGEPIPFVIDFQRSRNNVSVRSVGADKIDMDPYYTPIINTEAGPVYADMRRSLYHEIGHAAMSIDDTALHPKKTWYSWIYTEKGDQMLNVVTWENEVAKDFNEPKRTTYLYKEDDPLKVPVAKPAATKPAATTPPVTKPAATTPPVTTPPVAKPAVAKPPVAKPAATTPPVTKPK